MTHKRKIADLTREDTNRLLLALAEFQENLDEEDAYLPSELLPAVKKLATKLQAVPVRGSTHIKRPYPHGRVQHTYLFLGLIKSSSTSLVSG